MPNIGSVLKQEIARLSRRELRGEMQATKKASTLYRHHIAALRRQLSALERQVATLQRRVSDGHRSAQAASTEDGGPKLRFAAGRLRAQRTRHGLTAGDYAKLLNVSEQTVYNWEHGTHRPGQDRLAVIAELRGLGKRAVQARLEDMSGKPAALEKPAAKKRRAGTSAKKRATKKSATKRSATKSSTRGKSAPKTSPRRTTVGKKSAPRKSVGKKAATKRVRATKSTRRRTAGETTALPGGAQPAT